MSIIEISIFLCLVILISALQCFTTYAYFSGFFFFKISRKAFAGITFGYMLSIKFVPGSSLLRILMLVVFLGIMAAVMMGGTVEKKLYHVLAFTFSLTLCEFTFSTLTSGKGMNIQTEYLKWVTMYFLINMVFLILVIVIIKLLLYFREENSEGLTNKEYVLMSMIPLASLVIICLLGNMERLSKIITCLCLICINFSTIIIYDWIGRKNFEINRYSLIEEQNRYNQERIENQQEIVRMKHDLKNILIHIDASMAAEDYQCAQQQVGALLETKAFAPDEFTGCVPVDSILNVKIQKIKEYNITHDMNLQIPSDLMLEDKILDVSAILGNLLDNAIEAVLRIEEKDKRKIEIAIKFRDMKLIFHIRNTSNTLETDFSKVFIKSEKGKDRYGVGLSSIKERVDRLHGYYDLKYEEGYYNALIVLPI